MTEHKFPKTFDACPNCGSTRRFCQMVAQGLKLSKVASEQTPVLLSAEHIFDSLPPVKAQALFDCCYDCGTPYAFVLLRFQAKPQLYVPGGQPQFPHN